MVVRAPGTQPEEHRWLPRQPDRDDRIMGSRQELRWRSTPSTPRVNGGCVESLSSYARQFLGQRPSPMSTGSRVFRRPFPSTRSLVPAIPVARRNDHRGLRLSPAVCPHRDSALPQRRGRQASARRHSSGDRVLQAARGRRIPQVSAPVVRGRKGESRRAWPITSQGYAQGQDRRLRSRPRRAVSRVMVPRSSPGPGGTPSRW